MGVSERFEKGQRMLQQLSGDRLERGAATMEEVFPDFWRMHVEHLFGEVWTRPGLALRDRLIVNLTSLIFHKLNADMSDAMRWALTNGVTRDEILEVIMHVAHYAGWPCAVNAIEVAKHILPPLEDWKESQGDDTEEITLSLSEQIRKGQNMFRQLFNEPSRGTGRSDIGKVFPDFWTMMQAHLFGEVWTRPGLTLRARIMVNLTGLIIHKFDFGIANCIRWALNNGIRREEVLEIIMHVAHYAGWPCGVNALRVTSDVFAEKK